MSHLRMLLMANTPKDYIKFADPVVEKICAENWGDGTGITYAQAAKVKTLKNKFQGNTEITSFNEFQYFGCTYTEQNEFNGCTALSGITLPSTFIYITAHMFFNCSSLQEITIPDNVTTINNNAFNNCRKLASINIPDSVTDIKYSAFAICNHLTSIEIPSGVTKIDNYTFYNCSGLTSIKISSGVTSIGNYAFYNSKSLLKLTILAATPPTLVNNVFNPINSSAKIYVPSESVDAYKAATYWSTYADKIQAIPSD